MSREHSRKSTFIDEYKHTDDRFLLRQKTRFLRFGKDASQRKVKVPEIWMSM
jgi:hypothetical protein